MNCLVTKLKDSVDNTELMKLGELKINIKTKENSIRFYLLYLNGADVHYSIPVDIYDWSTGTKQESQVTSSDYNHQVIEIPANTEINISALNKYSIFYISCTYNDNVEFEFENFDYMSSMSVIDFHGSSKGSIKGLKIVPLKSNNYIGSCRIYISANTYDIYGNIEDIATPNFTAIDIAGNVINADVSGNIVTAFASSKSLNRLICTGTSKLSGSFDELFNTWVADGRTSGDIAFYKGRGLTFEAGASKASSWFTARFGTSMTNPTAEDTTRGWQWS